MKNPPPNPQDLEMLKKATTDGIKLPGSETATTLPASLVEEAIIVSELFKVSVCYIFKVTCDSRSYVYHNNNNNNNNNNSINNNNNNNNNSTTNNNNNNFILMYSHQMCDVIKMSQEKH